MVDKKHLNGSEDEKNWIIGRSGRNHGQKKKKKRKKKKRKKKEKKKKGNDGPSANMVEAKAGKKVMSHVDFIDCRARIALLPDYHSLPKKYIV